MSSVRKLKILIVDDEEIVRFTLMAFFERLEHESEGLEDGQAGLQALETGNYDIAFVDMRMPGLNGIDFLCRCRQIRPELPVVIITGHGSDDTRKKAMDSGAFGFLNKPFQFNDIKDLTERVCSAARRK